MILQNKSIYLFSFLILIFSACKKEEKDMPTGPSYISEENLFGCSNVEITHTDFGNEHVRNLYIKGGIYYYATFESLLIKDGADGHTLVEQKMRVEKFLTYNTKVIICATEGIFEVSDDFVLEQKTDAQCRDIEISPEGDLLFTHLGDSNYNVFQIYKLNVIENTATPYAPPHDESLCVTLVDISVHPGTEEIWGLTCGEKIIRYKNGEIIGFFNEKNAPLIDIQNIQEFFVLPYHDDYIVVMKSAFYQIYKYSDEEWITLKIFFDLNESESYTEKDAYMGVVSITDAIIDGDLLYVSTIQAGCRGIQVFDISTNEAFIDEDYKVIQDSDLPSQCAQGFFRSKSGIIYLFSQQGWVAVYNC